MVTNLKQKRIGNCMEVIVNIVILLVIGQTFLDDFVVIINAHEDFRQILLFTGFFFDLFFTIEFLVRLYNAMSRRRAMRYLIHERGWIDFLASVPLLMLSSGPTILAFMLEGVALKGLGGVLNMLKLIKAIRIARILRLLRIIKIFRSIKYTDSPMAQRHIAKIITICITLIVFSLFSYGALSNWVESVGPDIGFDARQKKILAYLNNNDKGYEPLLQGIELLEEPVLMIKKDGAILYSKYNTEYYRDNIAAGEYSYKTEGRVEIFYDRRAIDEAEARNQSWRTLFFFCVILLLLIAYLIIYSPHFALTVTDPIHVMKRGFSEDDYNLEVKLHNIYGDDDIFVLANLYNEVYLPLKDRNREKEENSKSDIKLDDIKDIFS